MSADINETRSRLSSRKSQHQDDGADDLDEKRSEQNAGNSSIPRERVSQNDGNRSRRGIRDEDRFRGLDRRGPGNEYGTHRVDEIVAAYPADDIANALVLAAEDDVDDEIGITVESGDDARREDRGQCRQTAEIAMECRNAAEIQTACCAHGSKILQRQQQHVSDAEQRLGRAQSTDGRGAEHHTRDDCERLTSHPRHNGRRQQPAGELPMPADDTSNHGAVPCERTEENSAMNRCDRGRAGNNPERGCARHSVATKRGH